MGATVRRTLHSPSAQPASASKPLSLWLLLVGTGVTAGAMVAIPARATYGERTTADEPQYLLSAISLYEDHDLDISDELQEQRWRAFHEAVLPQQTEPRADGSELSPHDPLLPLILAVPVGIGGWAGAKLTLSLLAGVLAAATLLGAGRRLAISPEGAAGTVLAVRLAP